MESNLEEALVRQIERFLLELGRGFMFVGTQQRVTINNTHYYVDMVFYNFGIILCTDKDALTAEDALGGLSNNIFASKYTYYIPDKEQLIAEVEKIIKKLEE